MSAPIAEAPSLPGHRYQRIGICQCRLRENDCVTGMWGSVDRVGVLARLVMTPEQHAQHIAELLSAELRCTTAVQLDLFGGAA